MTRFAIHWRPRDRSLDPTATVARDAVAPKLARALLGRPLVGLSGVASPRVLVVCGPTEALPWVDGVEYLGVLPGAPRLLLPTTREPVLQHGGQMLPVPADTLDAMFGDRGAPVAVLPEGRLVSLASARPLDVGALRAWLASAEAA